MVQFKGSDEELTKLHVRAAVSDMIALTIQKHILGRGAHPDDYVDAVSIPDLAREIVENLQRGKVI